VRLSYSKQQHSQSYPPPPQQHVYQNVAHTDSVHNDAKEVVSVVLLRQTVPTSRSGRAQRLTLPWAHACIREQAPMHSPDALAADTGSTTHCGHFGNLPSSDGCIVETNRSSVCPPNLHTIVANARTSIKLPFAELLGDLLESPTAAARAWRPSTPATLGHKEVEGAAMQHDNVILRCEAFPSNLRC
jgi:hypothetical protein